MTPALFFMAIYERTVLQSQVMSFLLYALLPRSYTYEEQGDVFFCYAL